MAGKYNLRINVPDYHNNKTRLDIQHSDFKTNGRIDKFLKTDIAKIFSL